MSNNIVIFSETKRESSPMFEDNLLHFGNNKSVNNALDIDKSAIFALKYMWRCNYG